ncbi:MAG TPA: PPK2 family polyphosphate kinase [Gemmatimonadaceae bacterium]|nr:PPK2 family polyphosphate kinase [Gemmatimonadaceae bacterium]
MRLKPVKARDDVKLRDRDASPPKSAPRGDERSAAITKHTERIGELQRVLYADARQALLIVLQGRDASGKDGTIRQVFSAVNPQGCQVTSFHVPTDIESRHDFLWRVHAQVPAHGLIGIFNRSHYEDVLVRRVHQLLPKRAWSARYEQINDFERMLTAEGVVILKFFLHVSRDEQKRRLTDRLTDRTKNWKFQAGDLDDRAKWSAYTRAYADMLRKCSTRDAPWFIVPADDKEARNWLIARTIADALEDMKLRYPRAPAEVRALTIP